MRYASRYDLKPDNVKQPDNFHNSPAKRSFARVYRSFEALDVCMQACRLAAQVDAELRSCRDFGLMDQMTRVAVSIASNIAKGAERSSIPDFVRLLHIAKGSAELRTQLDIAHRIGVIPPEPQPH